MVVALSASSHGSGILLALKHVSRDTENNYISHFSWMLKARGNVRVTDCLYYGDSQGNGDAKGNTDSQNTGQGGSWRVLLLYSEEM